MIERKGANPSARLNAPTTLRSGVNPQKFVGFKKVDIFK